MIPFPTAKPAHGWLCKPFERSNTLETLPLQTIEAQLPLD